MSTFKHGDTVTTDYFGTPHVGRVEFALQGKVVADWKQGDDITKNVPVFRASVPEDRAVAQVSAAHGPTARPKPSPEQLAAVRAYATRHGRQWKRALFADWVGGRSTGLLQEVRNQFGPAWLLRFQLDAPVPAAKVCARCGVVLRGEWAGATCRNVGACDRRVDARQGRAAGFPRSVIRAFNNRHED